MKYVLTSIIIFVLGLVGVLTPVKNLFLVFFTPIQFGLNNLAFGIKDASTFFTGSNAVRQENVALLQKNNQLEQKILDLKKFEEENSLLKTQLGIKTDSTKFIEATIMGDPNDLSGGAMLVNKGSKDGVAVGDMLTVGNYLIGTIKSVDYSRSHAELINSPNLSYTVYDIDSATKTVGLAVGKSGATIVMERILPTEEVKVGDTIVTLGKEGIFLPGFYVGKVINVISDPTQPLKSAEIKTVLDFSKITKVFILSRL